MPEPPIDPTDTETPVDHLAVARLRLQDCRRELDEADMPARKRSQLNIFAGALQAEIEGLR